MKQFKNKSQSWINEENPIYIKTFKLPKDHKGWLVIDSLGYGWATGGIRFGNNVRLEEIKKLAAEMTLKFSFYNLPIGGAKAGIYCPSSITKEERELIFFNFGEKLKILLNDRTYRPGTDMGTNQKDIENLFKGAGISKEYEKDPIDSSYNTAITTFSAVKTICYYNNLDLRGIRLGIQGLGKVGLTLLKLASVHGVKLVAGSTQYGALYSPKGLNVNKILDLAKKHGDEFVKYYAEEQKIELNEFFEKEMDIMCPCANIYPINKSSIEKIKAKIIVPGCNVAATENMEKQLYKMGVTYLPGFVSNAGGVLGYVLRRKGIQRNERNEFLSRGIQIRIKYLIEQSKKNGYSLAIAARSIVRENQVKFALLSEARLNGRLGMLTVLWKNYGIGESLLLVFWKLVDRKLLFPNFVRKYIVKKIIF